MSDPLMNFLNSVDRDKVMAEGKPNFERLYREAPPHVQSLIDEMPIGALRRKLATTEAALEAARRDRKERVRVVGNRELAQMVTRLRGKLAERDEINERQARMIAELRDRLADAA